MKRVNQISQNKNRHKESNKSQRILLNKTTIKESEDFMEINKNAPWEELTPGGTIYNAGNAVEFKTGDWRSIRPVFHPELCKQCGLCYPVCPDDSIPVGKDMKRGDFNYDYCKGCGVCAKVCPFGAITMEEEEK